ncbi:response regulator [Crocosphaera subtropica]|nr:response regulator transcription factor [Crocosphaera subtropica]
MSKISLVLVEDHDLTRVGLLAALKQVEQIEVLGEAANGHQGVKIIKEENPDLAIVALNLPDIDGIEVTQRLKNDPHTHSTRILILTNTTQEKDVLAAFVAGADSYLLKDIEFTQLIEAIKNTHEGNSWIDPNIANIVLQQIKKPVTAKAELSSVSVNHSSNNNHSVQLEETTCIEEDPQHLFEISPLTDREFDVLELIVGGCNNADIAEKLCITVGTVKTHVRNILNKLCVDDRTQAAVRALRSGLVE